MGRRGAGRGPLAVVVLPFLSVSLAFLIRVGGKPVSMGRSSGSASRIPSPSLLSHATRCHLLPRTSSSW